MREPETPAEVQIAATAACVCLMLAAGSQYGLLLGAPVINLDRCVAIIRRADRFEPPDLEDMVADIKRGQTLGA